MANRVNLLLLTHNYPRRPGDHAGVFIELLARNLVDFGIRPIILAPHDPGAAEREERHGAVIYRFRYAERDADEDIAYRGSMQHLVLGSVTGIFKFKRFLDSWRSAATQIIAREPIDLLAGHWLVPGGIVLRTLARQTGLPVVLSSHGTDIRLIRKYAAATYRYFRPFCRTLKRWTFVSSFLRDSVAAMDPSLGPILEVLPLPHDETLFFRDPAISREPTTIVSITRFTWQKRVDHLVRAFALLSERRPDVRLELYASAGPTETDVRALITRLGLQDRVAIHPPVPQEQLRTVYNRAGMVVLNSFQEGFGLALSEGMLCGAPVIGAASGGITDIIRHEERGLLVELDNAAALANAMERLLADTPLRTRLAEAGRQYAATHFASRPLAGRYADIIHEAVRR